MNKLVIQQYPDRMILRHGGPRLHRQFSAFVNDVEVEIFGEDDATTDYANGNYFDRYIAQWLKTWQKALQCKVTFAPPIDNENLIKERPQDFFGYGKHYIVDLIHKNTV